MYMYVICSQLHTLKDYFPYNHIIIFSLLHVTVMLVVDDLHLLLDEPDPIPRGEGHRRYRLRATETRGTVRGVGPCNYCVIIPLASH